MNKFSLLTATALTAAGLAATPAFAQDTGQSYQSANDIVVNATRRDETVQDVPVAITAVGAELLDNAGVTDIRGLEQLAPSLQTTTGQSAATGASLSIRGIGTGGDNPGFEPAVGVFIDGVFRSRAGVALSELPDLERVEILRGPQGTLFGRNTSAGALSVFTAQPRFEFGGHIEGSIGNYDAWEVNGSLTGPVVDQLALRVDAGIRKRDGYIRDANANRAFNDLDRYYVRGQALFDSGDVTFRLIADYASTDEQCCAAISVARGALAPLIQGIAAAGGRVGLFTGPNQPETYNIVSFGNPTNTITPTVLSVSTNPGLRTQAVSPNRDYGERVQDWGISGELNWDLGGARLTSITAYRDWQVRRNQDIDFSGIDRAYRDDYRVDITTFTQELRLQGEAFGGVLDWLIGGFYLNERIALRDTVRIGNDGNLFVDSVFNALAGPAFGGAVQFFGSLGPAVPTPGAVFLNPAVPNALPALQAVYGAALAPLVGCFRAQAGTAPAGLCVIPGFPTAPIPGLAALAASPLPAAVPGQGNNNDDFRVATDAFAFFTHNIININERLSLTLGARLNVETKTMNASINNNLGSCGFFNSVRAGNPAAVAYANLLTQIGLFNNLFLLSCNPAVNTEFNGNYNDRIRDTELTGTAKLAYKFSDRVLGYLSYDRGYKSGGFNLDQASFDSVLLGGNGPQGSDLRFGPELVDAYEIGVKASLSRVFTINAALFYSDFRNLQSLVFSGNNFIVQNVPSATSQGVELEGIIRPTSDLIIRLGYTLNDVRTGTGFRLIGASAGTEGLQNANQPRHIVNAAVTFTPRITSGLRALFHVDMRYNSEVNIAGVTNQDNWVIRNPGYALINARVGLQNDDGTIRGEFFVENLTNQYYNITGFSVPEQTNNFAGYPSMPRFWGFRARFGF